MDAIKVAKKVAEKVAGSITGVLSLFFLLLPAYWWLFDLDLVIVGPPSYYWGWERGLVSLVVFVASGILCIFFLLLTVGVLPFNGRAARMLSTVFGVLFVSSGLLNSYLLIKVVHLTGLTLGEAIIVLLLYAPSIVTIFLGALLIHGESKSVQNAGES